MWMWRLQEGQNWRCVFCAVISRRILQLLCPGKMCVERTFSCLVVLFPWWKAKAVTWCIPSVLRCSNTCLAFYGELHSNVWVKYAIKEGEVLSGLQNPVKGSRLRFNSWERFCLRYFHWFQECWPLIIYARGMFLLRHYVSLLSPSIFSPGKKIPPKSGNLTLHFFFFFNSQPWFCFWTGMPDTIMQRSFMFGWELTRCLSLWNNHHLLIVIARQKPKAWKVFSIMYSKNCSLNFLNKNKSFCFGLDLFFFFLIPPHMLNAYE